MHDATGGVVGDLARLGRFRAELYRCFGRWADAQFEMVDALAGADRPIRSVAELMFESVSRRGWGSLYQALERGQIDVEAGRDLLARWVRVPAAGPLMFAVDVSKMPRPDTRVVPDVGMQYAAERDRCGGVPAVPGWAMQWVTQVGLSRQAVGKGSWAVPMDVRRVGTADNANEIAAGQITDLAGRLARQIATAGVPVLFLLDVGYCPIYLTQHLPEGAQVLVRLRSDRVFFKPVVP